MKTALITGGAGGLGFEFARLAAKDGYQIVLADVQAEALQNAQKTLEKDYGVKVHTIQKNLASPDAGKEVFEELQKHQLKITILVNNVGIGTFGELWEVDWARQNTLLQLNVHLLTQLTYLLLPDMLAQKSGKILNMASMAAFQPCPFMATYYASKAYVLSLTESLANELKGTGVTATVFCPGPIPTGFQDAVAKRNQKLNFTIFHDTPERSARTGYRAMMAGKTVVVNTWINWLMSAMPRFLPRKVIVGFTRKMQESNAKSIVKK
ncbi:MAG: SDR family oxidoreductase [Bacteroidetes bacterium]|nr:MAG: SDR family oxidoreductase [Bacteroidota bacterium]